MIDGFEASIVLAVIGAIVALVSFTAFVGEEYVFAKKALIAALFCVAPLFLRLLFSAMFN